MPANNQRNADVKVTLEGLLGLCHNKQNGWCEVGILSAERVKNSCHKLSIKVTKISPSDAWVLSNAMFDLTSAGAIKTFEIDVIGTPQPGVSFRKYGEGLLDRNSDDHPIDDFRWVADLQSEEFHGKEITINTKLFRPVLIIKHGEFYTSELSTALFRAKGTDTASLFGKVANIIGIDLNLDAGSEVVLNLHRTDNANDNSPNSSLSLNLRKEEGARYEVIIENLCPVVETSGTGPDTGILPNDETSDFKYYYDATDVPEAKRYQLGGRVDEGGAVIVANPDNLCAGVEFSSIETFL